MKAAFQVYGRTLIHVHLRFYANFCTFVSKFHDSLIYIWKPLQINYIDAKSVKT